MLCSWDVVRRSGGEVDEEACESASPASFCDGLCFCCWWAGGTAPAADSGAGYCLEEEAERLLVLVGSVTFLVLLVPFLNMAGLGRFAPSESER